MGSDIRLRLSLCLVTSDQPLSPGICWSHSSPSPTLCPELWAFLFSCPHFPLGVGFFVSVLPHPQCSSPRLSRIGKWRLIGLLAQTKNLGSCPASPSSHTLLPASQRSFWALPLTTPRIPPWLSTPLCPTDPDHRRPQIPSLYRHCTVGSHQWPLPLLSSSVTHSIVRAISFKYKSDQVTPLLKTLGFPSHLE